METSFSAMTLPKYFEISRTSRSAVPFVLIAAPLSSG
jgi:hypothetical protein